ncbi:uncharacterized protein [Solanum lycopersicum]|uniref:uncharacterized protein n=1 Tax=Solanum lycopersicum TaxID=4081 RepID=UPI003747B217
MASKMLWDKSFQIKTYDPTHTCKERHHENRTITSSFIARKYLNEIGSNRNDSLADFRDRVNVDLRAKVTLSQVKRTKNKAISILDGDIKDQFKMMWDYCNEMDRTNPESTIHMKFTDNEVPGQPYRFQRIYICFAACKFGFKAGCRKVIGVDGFWLKGPMYGTQLLSAVEIDDPNDAVWCNEKEPSQWTMAYFSSNAQSDMLSNNVCEVYNSMILDTRDKPILTLLEKLSYLLMARMPANREKAEQWNLGDVCPKIEDILLKNQKAAGEYIPRKSNKWNYEIIGASIMDNWEVDLEKRTCSCRKWSLTGIPASTQLQLFGLIEKTFLIMSMIPTRWKHTEKYMRMQLFR